MVFTSNQFNRNTRVIGGGPGCLIMGILALVLFWFLLKGLYTLLYWVAPVLFVLALIINWRAVSDTGKDFLSLFKREPIMAIIVGAVSVMAFPLLALYLFLRALGYKRLQEIKRQFGAETTSPPREEEFVDYEELDSQPMPPPRTSGKPLDLEPEPDPEPAPRPRQQEPPKSSNPYDQMFNE